MHRDGDIEINIVNLIIILILNYLLCSLESLFPILDIVDPDLPIGVSQISNLILN